MRPEACKRLYSEYKEFQYRKRYEVTCDTICAD